MIAMLAWWGVLWLPGHAIARRMGGDDLRGGALASVGLGYLWSFALLTPVSLLGYAFGWPITVLTVAVLLAAAAGAIDLARAGIWDGWRRWRASSFVDVALLAALIVVADVAFGAHAGGHTAGDARLHVARVRVLLDHGFNNWDPYFADHPFSRVYHTNIYHALIAAGARLTGSLAVEAWVWTLAWAKLVGAAGVSFLAWRVLGSRLAAWLAGAAWCLAHAPITFAIYPNHVAPWLVALGLGLVATDEDEARPPTIELACCFLVLAQIHALYGVALAIAVTPLLLWRSVAAVRRRRVAWRHTALAILAPALLVPFLLATKYVAREAPAARPAPAAFEVDAAAEEDNEDDEEDEDDREDEDEANDDADDDAKDDPRAPTEQDREVARSRSFSAQHLWLLGALLLGLASPRRARVGALAAAVSTMLLVLYAQPLSSFLAEALGGRPWAVRRLGVVLRVASFALLPGVLLAFPRTERQRQGLAGLLLVICAAWWIRAGWKPSSFWGLQRYLSEAPAYSARALDSARIKTRFLTQAVPAGATVLTTPKLARHIVMLYDCYVVWVGRTSPGIPGAQARKRALAIALDPKASWDDRRAALNRHHVRYVVTRRPRGELHGGYRDAMTRIVRGPKLVVGALH